VLRQFTRQDQAYRCLYLTGRDGRLLGVRGELCSSIRHHPSTQRKFRLTGRFSRDALKDIVDEGIENSHRFIGNTSVRVHLLQHCTLESARARKYKTRRILTLVDVGRVGLLARALSLLLVFTRCWRRLLRGPENCAISSQTLASSSSSATITHFLAALAPSVDLAGALPAVEAGAF